MATNYVLLYKGGMGPEGRSEEEVAQVMEAWGKWYASVGSGIVDGGNPFGASMAVTSDGNTEPSGITGYTVISADDMSSAMALVKGHPHLDEGGTVEVYETFEM